MCTRAHSPIVSRIDLEFSQTISFTVHPNRSIHFIARHCSTCRKLTHRPILCWSEFSSSQAAFLRSNNSPPLNKCMRCPTPCCPNRIPLPFTPHIPCDPVKRRSLARLQSLAIHLKWRRRSLATYTVDVVAQVYYTMNCTLPFRLRDYFASTERFAAVRTS